MASATTLTDLIPTLYNALDVVSREMVGFIPAVSRDATHERAALNQSVRSFVAPAVTASDITPGATAADSGGQTIGNVDMTITKSRKTEIMWSGEEQLSVSAPGITAQRILQDQLQIFVNFDEPESAGSKDEARPTLTRHALLAQRAKTRLAMALTLKSIRLQTLCKSLWTTVPHWATCSLSSTPLLVLVCAFAGRPLVMEAYRSAVREGYRFYSFGDAMLVT